MYVYPEYTGQSLAGGNSKCIAMDSDTQGGTPAMASTSGPSSADSQGRRHKKAQERRHKSSNL